MNTQSKHTPGPWKVRTAYSNGEPVCYTIHLGQTSIADVTSLSEQDRVNATLIAAAPAMYEALKALVGEIDLSQLNVRKNFSLLNAHASAAKALAQAEGIRHD